jgi:signal transduction histidine kinase/CheY-like chemotaxis protein
MFRGYFSNLLEISEKMDWYENDFKDSELEFKYKSTNQDSELKKSKIYYLLICISYGSSTILNLRRNDYKFVRSTYVLLIALLFENILMFISHYNQNNFKLFFNLKLMRYIAVYLAALVLLLFPVIEYNIESFIRMTYLVIVCLTILYIYFIHFNFVILILIPIVNFAALLWLQFTLFSEQRLYLLPELLGNLICHWCTFLIKRNEIIHKKEMFLRNYQYKNYIEYINKLVDVLNTMVISIKNSDVLFMNQYSINYFEDKKKSNMQTTSLLTNENKENEILLSNEEKRKSLLKSQVESFFKSIILYHSYDTIKYRENEGKSLSDIIKEKSWDHELINDLFKRIGIFSQKIKGKEQHFEVYIRKVKINDEVLELLIYDISNIKIAEKTNIETKYKQKILAKIAHEFKTPLINIITLIQSLNDQHNTILLQSSIKKKLSHVVNLSNYIIYLIQDIIQYVSESSKLKISLNNINLKDILHFCYEVLHTLIDCNENKSQSIETFLDYDQRLNQINILSDENRLKQIFLNLISNSVKFTTSGHIKLKAYINQDYNTIVISVEDTGIGIKEEDFHLIFQDNVQLNLEKEYNTKGSGLGLGISKLLANSLNHELNFESKHGKGTAFYLSIHLNDTLNQSNRQRYSALDRGKCDKIFINNSSIHHLNSKDEIHDSQLDFSFRSSQNPSINSQESQLKLYNLSKVSQQTIEKKFDLIKYYEVEELLKEENEELSIFKYNFTLRGINQNFSENCIVVVDDQKLVRLNTINLIKTILSNLNIHEYSIIEGSDGIDLLNIVRRDQNGSIKCIFTDENMEYLNGSEVISIIRKLEQNYKVKYQYIVSITAFDDIGTRNNILNSGVNSILSKPCSKTALTEILRRIFIN